jgi:hypothetical protein
MHRVLAKLFRVDRQTDLTKLIVAFNNFGKVSKKKLWEHFKIPRGRPPSVAVTVE